MAAGEVASPQRLFTRLALAAAALTFVVVVASAFLRHTQAGVGCGEWPSCYGRVQPEEAALASVTVRIARIVHRVTATAVLASILGLLLIAWTQRPAWRRAGTLAALALAIVVALATVGVVTPGARVPAVTLGNLLGGYLLLAVLSAAACATVGSRAAHSSTHRPAWTGAIVTIALSLVLVQSLLGGLLGADYALADAPLHPLAVLAIDRLPQVAAFDPFRPLQVVAGRFVAPSDAGAIVPIHAAVGAVTATMALLASIASVRRAPRLARGVAALACATPLAGAAAIAALPSLALTMLHNACSALLIAMLAAIAAKR